MITVLNGILLIHDIGDPYARFTAEYSLFNNNNNNNDNTELHTRSVHSEFPKGEWTTIVCL